MAENIGSISVSVIGDLSDFQEKMQQLDQMATASGKSAADLLSAGFAAGAGTINEALDKVIGEFKSFGDAATGAKQPLLEFGTAAQAIIDKQKLLDDAMAEAAVAVVQLREGYNAGQVSANALAQAEQALKDAVSAANVPLKEYGDTAQSIVDRERELQSSIDQHRQALAELKTAQEQGAVSAETVARAEQDLKSAIDAAKVSGEEQLTTLQKFTEASGSLMQAGASITAAVTVPILGIGAAAFESANTIDEAMDMIRARTGETGEALTGLGDSFRTVFANVPEDAKTVSAAMSEIHDRLGLVGQPLEDLSQKLINLGHMMGESIPQMASLATEAFNKWGVSSDQMGGKLDEVMRAAQATGAPVNDLLKAVTQFAAPMQEFGMSFEQTLAIMGSFEKEGVNTGQAMAGLRKELGLLAAAGVDPQQAFSTLIDSIKNAKTETEGLQLSMQVFGQRAGAEMFAAIRSGKLDFDALTQSIKDGHDTITQATADTRSWGENWQIFKNQLTLALEPLGVTLVQAATNALNASKPLLDTIKELTEWFGNLPAPVQEAAIGLGAVLAAIGPLVAAAGGLGFAIQGITGALEALGVTSATVVPEETALAESQIALAAAAESATVAELELATAEGAVGDSAVVAGSGMAAFGSAAAGLGLPALAAGFAALALNVGDVSGKLGDLLSKYGINLSDWIVGFAKGEDAATIAAKSLVDSQDELNRRLSTSADAIKQASQTATDYAKNLKDTAATTDTAAGATDKAKLSLQEIQDALAKGKNALVEYDGALTKATHSIQDVDSISAMYVAQINDVAAAHQKWSALVKDTTDALGPLATAQEVVDYENQKLFASWSALIDEHFKAIDVMKTLKPELEDTAKALDTIGVSSVSLKGQLDPVQQAMKDLGVSVNKTATDMVADFMQIATATDSVTGKSTDLGLVQEAWKKVSGQVRILADTDLPDAVAAYDAYIQKLKDGGASAGDILRAQEDEIQLVINKLKDQGQSTADLQIKLHDLQRAQEDLRNSDSVWDDIRVKLDATKTSVGELKDKIATDLVKAYQDAFRGFSKGLSDLIVDGGKFGDTMEKIFKDWAKKVLDDLLNVLLTPLKDAVASAMSGIIKNFTGGGSSGGGLGGILGGIFGGGGKSGGIGIPGVDEEGGVPFGGIIGGGGGAGGAAGGLSGVLGSVGSIIGIAGAALSGIGSIGSFIQGFSQSTDLGHIEENTRVSAIVLRDFIQPDIHNELYHVGDGVWYSLEHLVNIENILNDLDAAVHSGAGMGEGSTGTPSVIPPGASYTVQSGSVSGSAPPTTPTAPASSDVGNTSGNTALAISNLDSTIATLTAQESTLKQGIIDAIAMGDQKKADSLSTQLGTVDTQLQTANGYLNLIQGFTSSTASNTVSASTGIVASSEQIAAALKQAQTASDGYAAQAADLQQQIIAATAAGDSKTVATLEATLGVVNSNLQSANTLLDQIKSATSLTADQQKLVVEATAKAFGPDALKPLMDTIDSLRAQQSDLQDKLAAAVKDGNTDLANTLAKQLDDVNGQLTTAVGQFTDMNAAVKEQSGNSAAVVAATQAMEAALKTGDIKAISDAASQLQTAMDAQPDKIAEAESHLMSAIMAGNTADITSALAELQGAMADNAKEVTAQQTSAKLDALQGINASVDQQTQALANAKATLDDLKGQQQQLLQDLIIATANGDTDLKAAVETQLGQVNGQLSTAQSSYDQLLALIPTQVDRIVTTMSDVASNLARVAGQEAGALGLSGNFTVSDLAKFKIPTNPADIEDDINRVTGMISHFEDAINNFDQAAIDAAVNAGDSKAEATARQQLATDQESLKNWRTLLGLLTLALASTGNLTQAQLDQAKQAQQDQINSDTDQHNLLTKMLFATTDPTLRNIIQGELNTVDSDLRAAQGMLDTLNKTNLDGSTKIVDATTAGADKVAGAVSGTKTGTGTTGTGATPATGSQGAIDALNAQIGPLRDAFIKARDSGNLDLAASISNQLQPLLFQLQQATSAAGIAQIEADAFRSAYGTPSTVADYDKIIAAIQPQLAYAIANGNKPLQDQINTQLATLQAQRDALAATKTNTGDTKTNTGTTAQNTAATVQALNDQITILNGLKLAAEGAGNTALAATYAGMIAGLQQQIKDLTAPKPATPPSPQTPTTPTAPTSPTAPNTPAVDPLKAIDAQIAALKELLPGAVASGNQGMVDGLNSAIAALQAQRDTLIGTATNTADSAHSLDIVKLAAQQTAGTSAQTAASTADASTTLTYVNKAIADANTAIDATKQRITDAVTAGDQNTVNALNQVLAVQTQQRDGLIAQREAILGTAAAANTTAKNTGDAATAAQKTADNTGAGGGIQGAIDTLNGDIAEKQGELIKAQLDGNAQAQADIKSQIDTMTSMRDALSSKLTETGTTISDVMATIPERIAAALATGQDAIQAALGAIASAISAIQPSIINNYYTSNYSTVQNTQITNQNTSPAAAAASGTSTQGNQDNSSVGHGSGAGGRGFDLGGFDPVGGMAVLHPGEYVLTPDEVRALSPMPLSSLHQKMDLSALMGRDFSRMPSFATPSAPSSPTPSAPSSPTPYAMAAPKPVQMADNSIGSMTIQHMTINEAKDPQNTVREIQKLYRRLTPKAGPLTA